MPKRRVPSTHSSASPYAGTTPRAVHTAKSSCYARVYAGTSAKPVIADEVETMAFAETPYNHSLTSNFS